MRILAVDDDAIMLQLLSVLIQQVGDHELICATNSLDAMSIVYESNSNLFDCILLDIDMPGINGIELCSHIRALPVYSATPILMITGLSDRLPVIEAFAAGANDYLNKPFEIDQLKGRLDRLSVTVESHNGEDIRVGELRVGNNDEFDLKSPIRLNNVTRTIEYNAMENYLAQLSRSFQNETSVFSIKILGAADLFATVSVAEFKGVVSCVAEAISEALGGMNILISYSGNGTYSCVAPDGWVAKPDWVTDAVEAQIALINFHLSDGRDLAIRVCTGKPVRLTSCKYNDPVDALLTAQRQADELSKLMDKDLVDRHIYRNLG